MVMESVVKVYGAVLGCIMVLTLCRIARVVLFTFSTYSRRFPLANRCRRLFIGTLVYRVSHRGFWSWLPSPFHLICAIIYLVWTGICNVVKVRSIHEAGSRAAHMALINLIPMFLSGGYEFGARLLGVTLETYGIIHRTIGLTAVIQAIIHVVITAKTRQITTADDTQFYGIVVGLPGSQKKLTYGVLTGCLLVS